MSLMAMREDDAMRKLSCLVLLISGLAFGCGDSDSDKDDAEANNGGGNDAGDNNNNGGLEIPDAGSMGGEDELPFPECPRDDIPGEFPKYMGMLTMTQAGYQACNTMCGQDQDCYTEANCPGVDAFNECLNNDVVACTAKTGGKCRTEYENFVCCTAEFQCGAEDQACVDTNCGSEITEIRDCLPMDMICIQQAGASCFAPAAPAMSATIGASAASVSIESLSVLLQKMSVAH